LYNFYWKLFLTSCIFDGTEAKWFLSRTVWCCVWSVNIRLAPTLLNEINMLCRGVRCVTVICHVLSSELEGHGRCADTQDWFCGIVLTFSLNVTVVSACLSCLLHLCATFFF
jgi:hypothetical protein